MTDKQTIKQLKNFVLIILSMLAGIDDFTCNPNWDKNKSIWWNAKHLGD